jgi:hypothetical protein
MTTSSPSGNAAAAAEPRRSAADLLVFIAAGALFGILLLAAPFPIAILLAGSAGAAVWIAFRPVVGILLILAGTCFIPFRHVLPGLGAESIHVPDLLLAYLLAGLAARHLVRPGGLRGLGRPAALPLFCLVATGALIWGWHAHGTRFFAAFKEYKVVLYYLLALLIPQFIDNRRDLRVLTVGAMGLGALYAGLAVVTGVFLSRPSSRDPEDVFYALSRFAGGSGTILVFWCLCCALCLVAMQGPRPHGFALILLCLTYFGLMFHRHMYLAIGFTGLVYAFMFLRHRSHLGRLAAIATLLVLVIGTGIVFGPPVVKRYADLTWRRLHSLATIADSATVSNRMLENRYALEHIARHPITGIGFARDYRPPIYGPQDGLRWFLHNGYIWIALKMGVIGLLCFLWLYAGRVFAGWRLWARLPAPWDRALVAGSTLTLIGMAPANLVAATFMQDWGAAAFAFTFGLIEYYRRAGRAERSEPLS